MRPDLLGLRSGCPGSAVFWLAVLLCTGNANPEAATLDDFTGAKTKAVWITQPGRIDTYARGDRHSLMALDPGATAPRVLLAGPGAFHRPLFTADGKKVIFTDRKNNTIHMVDWDGGDPVLLAGGGAAAVWRDPDDGRTYVYAQQTADRGVSPLIRFPLDEPDAAEVVWSLMPIVVFTPGSSQLSRDGRRFVALFPWPVSGVGWLPEAGWRRHREGCWPGLAPDNSYMHWTFDGSHRLLFMDRPGAESWRIDLSKAPGIDGEKVYHPRWTNHVRFLVMTGPYFEKKSDKRPPDIFVGRFSKGFDKVEDWYRIDAGRGPAYFPDVWIDDGWEADSGFDGRGVEDGETEGRGWFDRLVDRLLPVPVVEDVWPGTQHGLVFLWQDHHSDNQFADMNSLQHRVRMELHGSTRIGPHGQLHLGGGAASVVSELSRQVMETCRETNELAVEVIIHPRAANQTGPARVLTLSSGERERNFMLGQQHDRMVFRLRTTETGANGVEFLLPPVTEGRPAHLLISFRDHVLTCYMDGEEVARQSLAGGDFSNWGDFTLLFGNEHRGRRPWSGYLDGIAIYARGIDADEAAAKHRLAADRLARRVFPETLQVRARLLERIDPPDPEDVDPYRRALAVNRYLVLSGGAQLEGKEIEVAEWCLLDRKVPADYSGAAVGDERALVLEDFESHPQLESERLLGGSTTETFPLFYSVESGHP